MNNTKSNSGGQDGSKSKIESVEIVPVVNSNDGTTTIRAISAASCETTDGQDQTNGPLHLDSTASVDVLNSVINERQGKGAVEVTVTKAEANIKKTTPSEASVINIDTGQPSSIARSEIIKHALNASGCTEIIDVDEILKQKKKEVLSGVKGDNLAAIGTQTNQNMTIKSHDQRGSQPVALLNEKDSVNQSICASKNSNIAKKSLTSKSTNSLSQCNPLQSNQLSVAPRSETNILSKDSSTSQIRLLGLQNSAEFKSQTPSKENKVHASTHRDDKSAKKQSNQLSMPQLAPQPDTNAVSTDVSMSQIKQRLQNTAEMKTQTTRKENNMQSSTNGDDKTAKKQSNQLLMSQLAPETKANVVSTDTSISQIRQRLPNTVEVKSQTTSKENNLHSNTHGDNKTAKKQSNQLLMSQLAPETKANVVSADTSMSNISIQAVKSQIIRKESNIHPSTHGDNKTTQKPSTQDVLQPSMISTSSFSQKTAESTPNNVVFQAASSTDGNANELVNKYGPFVLASDSSINDARKRLRIALEQTRILREAFSIRVYEKYRIVLRPVPKTVDDITNNITSQPKLAYDRYVKEIEMIKLEKEAEKKDAQIINQELVAVNRVREAAPFLGGLSGVENADQLSWFNAGLSLVILPEENVDEAELEARGIQYRGPINPDTGARVGGISAAATSAACVMLDRVRKGNELRMERKRKRQLGELDSDEGKKSCPSHFTFRSVSTYHTPKDIRKKSNTSKSGKQVKKNVSLENESQSLNCTGKVAKSKPLPSTAILLSLLPEAEGVTLDGKFSAVGAALMCRVGRSLASKSNGKSLSNQQLLRHPFPQSKGARSSVSHGQSRRKATSSNQAHTALGTAILDSRDLKLPPLMTPRERRIQTPLPFVSNEKNFNKNAMLAIGSVLKQFVSQEKCQNEEFGKRKRDNNEEIRSKEPVDCAVKSEHEVSKIRTRTFKRHITEISLLKNMRQTLVKVDSNNASPQPEMVNTRPLQNSNSFIDPLLAFSVMHSLGLVTESDQAPQSFDNNFVKEKPNEKYGFMNSLKNQDIMGSDLREEPLSNYFLKELPKSEIGGEDASMSLKSDRPVKKNKINGEEGNNQNDNLKSKATLISKPLTSNYILSLRGGGKSAVNINRKKLKKKIEKQNHMNDMNECRTDSPRPSSVISSLLNNGASPFAGTGNRSGRSLSLSRPSSAAPSSSKQTSHLDQQQQIRAQQRHNNEILQVIWGEQQNRDLALLHSQSSPPIIPHHVTSLDSTYSMLAQGAIRPETISPSLYPTQTNQPPNSGTTLSTNGRIQGQQQQQHSLSRPLGGAHDHHHGNPAVSSHQLHFVQNSLQNATSALNSTPLLHHTASDIDYLQAAGYASNAEWGTLGVHSLLPSHPSLTSSAIGLASHQAAIVGLTARERVFLATEQMQARVAAAHHNAAVISNGASLPSLSLQPASAFIDSSSNVQNASAQINSSLGTSVVSSRKTERNTSKATAEMESRETANTAFIGSKASLPVDLSSSLEDDNKMQKRPASASDWPSLLMPSSVIALRRPASADSRLVSLSTSRAKSITGCKDSNVLKRKIATTRTNNKLDNNISGNVWEIDPEDIKNNLKASGKRPRPSAEKFTLNADYAEKLTKKEPDLTDIVRSLPVKVGQQNARAGSVCSFEMKKKLSGREIKNVTGVDSVTNSSSLASVTTGLRFFVPPCPDKVTSKEADLVCRGFFHEVVSSRDGNIALNQTPSFENKNQILLNYLSAVGLAVPIPKTIVANPLKERLHSLSYRSVMTDLGNNVGSTALSREVICAVINTWLWANHQESFEKAFAKSGRIDVDPHCKWLIHAAIENSLRAISIGLDVKSTGTSDKGRLPIINGNAASSPSTTMAINIASLISRALMRSYYVNEQVDKILPRFSSLVKYLDEQRMSALRARSQERVLLAALVSRRTRMSEPFSHAYTSSMIRSAEALGYEELCDIVQDEATMTSTLLPFDILSDSTGAWEDPCRPQCGFISGQSADELSKRAHSRAIIQKSLKKLQDRHGIKGGTPNVGSYTDSRQSDSDASSKFGPLKVSPSSRGSGGRRRSSSDTSALQTALTSALFNPNHYSSPFVWDTTDGENMPYGRHEVCGKRVRSASELRSSLLDSNNEVNADSKKIRLDANQSEKKSSKHKIKRSTIEIEWADVAKMFQPATIGNAVEKLSSLKSNTHARITQKVVGSSAIFAPFCRKRDIKLLPESDTEFDSSEDLSDEKILESHQKVLNVMKDKFDSMMVARKQHQDRSRHRSSGGR